ncbi:MAG: redoxin domain-containing protein [Pirellulales bacterium]|nr:redoxin domain-containing protein [Pirellulales bacterium]MBL7192864.1 redoxin domain-containing protein [Pirellulales bacterium]
MRRFSHRVSALLFLCGGGLIASWAAQRPLLAEEHPPRFATVAAQPLPSSQEGVQSLDDILAPFRVICFLGTECPLAKLYGPRLDRLATEMADAGVAFIGINSNPQDSLADIATYVEQHHVRFPVLKDVNQAVAVALGATRTPEVVVIDDTGAVCYRGRIDDQYDPGVARPEPTAHYLADALVELTTGKPVTLAITEPTGCLMQLPDPAGSPEPTTSLTFAKEISRVLQKHCVECHQAGEIGPFALEDYDEVIGWGDMLLEVIDQKRMPPWHADSQHGAFANARDMPPADIALLREWVEGGMPFGDAADLPPPLPHAAEWDLPRPPDLVFGMSETPFAVPSEGIVEYQYFVVDPGFKEDVWVKGVAVDPGNRSVVHHAIVFLRPPDGSSFNGFGLLGGYVPGQKSLELPTGYAQRIAAGTLLAFQMHYTPTGRPEEDLTRIGLILADPDEVTHEVYTVGGIEQDFEIPPGVSEYSVAGEMRGIPSDGSLLAINPHMHLRGRSVRLFADREGQSETLLSVPHYDFNWQHNYAFASPPNLSEVDGLRFEMTYDNSKGNPFNPDPTEYVTWGDQTWEEMAVVFATVARPKGIREASESNASEDETAAREAAVIARAESFADDYLAKLDADSDGAVSHDEAPEAVRMFSFRQLDIDSDGFVRRDELVRHGTERFGRSESRFGSSR